MARKVFKAIKTKAKSAVLKSLHVEELTADAIIDITHTAQISKFAVTSKTGWLPCDGRVISYFNDTSPGYTQTAYENLILLLKSEAGTDAGHPYYSPDPYQAVIPNKTADNIEGEYWHIKY